MRWTARKQAEARVGTLLDGKWTLETFLGYGGSAAVYGATHRNGKRAAIKILHAHGAADPDLVARFTREGYLANKIQHPGIVSVLDDDKSDDGSVYLVMDLLEGRSFEQHGRGLAPPLSIVEALQIADDLLDILVAAHAIGLVHRDIKPGNLFLTSNGALKILDFGIARLTETFSEGVTQTGMLMGTPAFMPPEQARGRWEDVDARSDLWAVGVTLSTLMTGKRPRTADTPAEELLAAMMQPMPSLATILPNAPPQVIALIDRAYAFERADRWQSAAEMQEAVRDARRMLQGPGPFAPSTTLRFAPETGPRPSYPDSAPPSGGPGLFSGSTLLTPALVQAAYEPEPPPNLTTHGAMVTSSALGLRSGKQITLMASLGLLAIVAVVAGGVGLARRSHAGAHAAPAEETATPGPPATSAARAGEPIPDPAPSSSDPAPSAASGSTTAPAASSSATKRDKKPKPKPVDGDPNKFFDNRF